MPVTNFSTSSDGVGFAGDSYVLQEAISGYSDEAYTNAKKLSGTGLVGSNDQIDPNTETFIGQVRWNKPLNPEINIASLTDATDGNTTSYGTDYLRYIKSVRTHGAKKINMQEVVTRQDGLAKIGRDFGETRAQDEHNAILSILKGVALSEVINGAGAGSGSAGLGGQTFDNDPADKKYGFYVDIGSSKLVTDAASANIGAQRASGFLEAFGKAYKDYEPDYAYLIVSPETYASLRSANLVDADKVTDGNVSFNTIFQGKFRLLQTRASQGFTTAELTKINTGPGVNITGTKTSFMVLPGSIAMRTLAVPMPTEIDRAPAAFKGGGTTQIWYRWGYVFAPAGYDWLGSEEEFASDASYKYAVESSTPKAFTTVTDALANTTGTWNRKFSSALSLGILPVFHS
jgi:hypothetical protein